MVDLIWMRVLTIVHQADAGPGVFAQAAADAGHELVEWRPPDAPPPEPDGYGAAIVLGGAINVDEEDEHPWLRDEKRLLRGLVDNSSPVLGVCLGAQLLAEVGGGSAGRASRSEIGWHDVELTAEAADDPVVGGLPQRFEAFQWHSFEATPPPGASALARSPVCVQAYRAAERSWGIQFHAEVTRATIERWIGKRANDPDAARAGIDPAELLADTRGEIERWNELGRALCGRFLAVADCVPGAKA
ncbi:MAG TPA: type 1 glutamine amidotransferase [Solirubrobacterales bacterium]|nr:type 1 glutamine amidotransferase [Solirubrobacterales bacterium]